MSSETSDFFHCPAYKLRICDLQSAVLNPPPRGAPGEDAESSYEWSLELPFIEASNGEKLKLETSLVLNIKLVWVQAIVVKIDEVEATLVITDDEGKHEAVIYEYNTIPGGNHPDIELGSYIGVIAQIWSNEPQIVLKPVKIMHLDKTKGFQSTWENEVKVDKAFLAGLFAPEI